MTRDGRVGWSAVSTLTTGVLGWVSLVVVGRSEGPAAFATFAVVWALFFGVGGALAGLQQEVTRTVTAADRGGGGATTLLGPVLLLTLPVVAVVVIASVVDADAEQGAALGLGLVGLGLLTFVAGGLAARDAWRSLASLMVGDAVLRTVAVVLCVTTDRTDLLPWAIAVGAYAWAPLLVLPAIRAAVASSGADPVPALVRKSLAAMAGTGCAALLVAGFPLLVSLARPGDLSAGVGILLATLILVRAPLLVVLYGFRPVVLRGFLAPEVHVPAAVRRWWLVLGSGGVVGVAAAALAGPPVVRAVFGEDYSTDAVEFAVLAGGSVLLAMLVVSGIALVALDHHRASVLGWLAAVTASLAALAAPASDRTAILLACTAGPAVGLAVHAALLGGPATSSARAA